MARAPARYLARYVVLALIVACACWVRGSGARNLVRILSNPDAASAAPFEIIPPTRTIGTSELKSDQILSIDGRPLRAYRQFEDAIFRGKPGDTIVLVLSEPNGRAFEKSVAIQSQKGNFGGAGKISVALLEDVAAPLVFIFLGALVVAVRPGDRNAWLLLLLLLAFAETTAHGFGPSDWPSIVWNQTLSGFLPLFLMLFGVYFPERAPFEEKHPGLKYFLLAPATVVPLISAAIYLLWLSDVNAADRYRGLFAETRFLQLAIGIVAIGMYFLGLAWKSRTAVSADSRRRLKILLCGASIGLGPAPALFLDVPPPVEAVALALLTVFPLTLAYAIAVERAMDLRVMARSVLARVSQRLDRRFFRESYDAERALERLAKEVGAIPEVGPLLENVAGKIAAALHVPDIVILLREGDVFVPRYSTRPGEQMNVAAAGHIAQTLLNSGTVLPVCFDKLAPWIRGLTAEELQTLDFMRTQLLLPLTGGGQLTGIVSLGAKLSDAPYSNVEVGLLRAIGSQISQALEHHP